MVRFHARFTRRPWFPLGGAGSSTEDPEAPDTASDGDIEETCNAAICPSCWPAGAVRHRHVVPGTVDERRPFPPHAGHVALRVIPDLRDRIRSGFRREIG